MAEPAKAESDARARVTVENVNVPGYSSTVDGTKYRAMRGGLLRVLPTKGPGLTQSEMIAACTMAAPEELFPDSAKVGWWTKCVQLDLDAKGIVRRDGGKPLRWRRVGRVR